MKTYMRSEMTYLFWLSYVVFLPSAWKKWEELPSTGQENNVSQPCIEFPECAATFATPWAPSERCTRTLASAIQQRPFRSRNDKNVTRTIALGNAYQYYCVRETHTSITAYEKRTSALLHTRKYCVRKTHISIAAYEKRTSVLLRTKNAHQYYCVRETHISIYYYSFTAYEKRTSVLLRTRNAHKYILLLRTRNAHQYYCVRETHTSMYYYCVRETHISITAHKKSEWCVDSRRR